MKREIECGVKDKRVRYVGVGEGERRKELRKEIEVRDIERMCSLFCYIYIYKERAMIYLFI